MKVNRQKQKQETKEKILKSAFEEFSSKGILATKTLDIANAANLSHGALFVHFPSREALLLAVIDAFGMQLGIQLENQVKRGSVEEVLSTHLDVLKQWEPFYIQLVICAPHVPEDIRSAIINIQSGIGYHLENALSNHKFTVQAPQHLILNTWLGLVHYYLANRDLFSPNRSVLTDKGPELIKFFINLIKGVSL